MKLKRFAASVGADDIRVLAELFGPRWAYMLQPAIMAQSIEGETFPDEESALRDADERMARIAKRESEFESQANKVTQRNVYELDGGHRLFPKEKVGPSAPRTKSAYAKDVLVTKLEEAAVIVRRVGKPPQKRFEKCSTNPVVGDSLERWK
jgi:hypothetical protein